MWISILYLDLLVCLGSGHIKWQLAKPSNLSFSAVWWLMHQFHWNCRIVHHLLHIFTDFRHVHRTPLRVLRRCYYYSLLTFDTDCNWHECWADNIIIIIFISRLQMWNVIANGIACHVQAYTNTHTRTSSTAVMLAFENTFA